MSSRRKVPRAHPLRKQLRTREFALLLLSLVAAGSLTTFYLFGQISNGETAHSSSIQQQHTIRTSVFYSEPEKSRYITEYPVGVDSGPNAITMDSEGNIWFTVSRGVAIGELNPLNGTVHEFELPEPENTTLLSWGILVDRINTNRVWFTDDMSNALWSFDVSTHTFTKHPLPGPLSSPYQIAQDQAGNIWFTELAANKLGEIFAHNGTLHEFSIPVPLGFPSTPGMGPAGMVIDNNDKIWFTEVYADSIGSFSGGRFQQFNLFGKIEFPNGIAIDGSGDLWITQHGPSLISEFNPATGTLRSISTSVIGVKASLPYFIEVDSHGDVWFNEHYGNAIAKFVPSNNSMVEYEIPSRIPSVGNISAALTLTLSPSGHGEPWFTEFDAGKIGTVNQGEAVNLRIGMLNSTSSAGTYLLPAGGNSSLKVSVESSLGERVTLSWAFASPPGNLTLQFTPGSGTGSFTTTLLVTQGVSQETKNFYSLTVSAVGKEVIVSQVVVLET